MVMRVTDEFNASVKGSRATVEGLKQHLSAGEIIELLINNWPLAADREYSRNH